MFHSLDNAPFSFAYGRKKLKESRYFQGNRQRNRYFEGWYFKMVSADQQSVFAVIPGIALGKRGEGRHAFIQIINGQTAETRYYPFDIEDFAFSMDKFGVKIGKNEFSDERIYLQIPGKLEGEVTFSGLQRFPSYLFSPGIMGWYRFAPFLECYHGVVSLDHQLQGELLVEGNKTNFKGGKGYIEKDWGRSFPSSWIWMQTNHFEQNGTSFMCSVADIPWIGNSFTGFLGFLLHEGKVYRFATYTGAKLKKVDFGDNHVRLEVHDKHWILQVDASRSKLGILAAPSQGIMERRIAESLDAQIHVTLTSKSGKALFSGSGSSAGLELVGDIGGLIKRLNG